MEGTHELCRLFDILTNGAPKVSLLELHLQKFKEFRLNILLVEQLQLTIGFRNLLKKPVVVNGIAGPVATCSPD